MTHHENKPNMILINCDDLGYGDLGCYGSANNQTPNLDRMANQGVLCKDFYMASPVCSPSRGAMMTGCYPPRIGFATFDNRNWVAFPGNSTGLNPDEVTIARLLKEQGYATLHVGKWHCGDQPEFLPTRHGFDQYFGLPYSNDMGRQIHHENMPPLPLMLNEQVIQQQPDQAALTERYVSECIRFMRQHRHDQFFIYFAHMYVHLPIYPPAHFLAQSKNGAYGGAVACIDWSVGVLLHELHELGLDDNTLVVFTSDNGARGDRGGSNAPLRGRKGTAWEGGLRVPGIFRWTGGLPGGITTNQLLTSMDLLPTFARLAGAQAPAVRSIDGKDILDVLRNGENSPHQAFYYYLLDDLLAVRSGEWKLHLARDGYPICELYNLRQDIGETTNLAGKYPDNVKELEKLAASCRQDLGDHRLGIIGGNCRKPGKVQNPKTLTQYEPSHPYIIALYDLEDRG
jgi:arylsulfatase A